MLSSKVTHWVVSLLAFGLPIILASHSPYLGLTIGGLLNAIYLGVVHLNTPTA